MILFIQNVQNRQILRHQIRGWQGLRCMRAKRRWLRAQPYVWSNEKVMELKEQGWFYNTVNGLNANELYFKMVNFMLCVCMYRNKKIIL